MTRVDLKSSTLGLVALAAAFIAVGSAGLHAQRGQPEPPVTPRASAPIDITGYWQSIIVDDFRFRVTPQKGDIEYLPLTEEAKRVANEWDPDADIAAGQQCRAYGAIGIMQQPGRFQITWEDDYTLKLEADSGRQTRFFSFAPKPSRMPEPSLQGYSQAQWVSAGRGGRGGGRGGGIAPAGGELEVVTTNMLPGYLRKNGVPYSADAIYTERFYLLSGPGGEPFLTVTTVVVDPVNLTQPFVYAYHFRRQSDATGWAPTPCWNR